MLNMPISLALTLVAVFVSVALLVGLGANSIVQNRLKSVRVCLTSSDNISNSLRKLSEIV